MNRTAFFHSVSTYFHSIKHKLLGIIPQRFMLPDLHCINLQDFIILIMKIMKHSVSSISLLLSGIFGMKSI